MKIQYNVIDILRDNITDSEIQDIINEKMLKIISFMDASCEKL